VEVFGEGRDAGSSKSTACLPWDYVRLSAPEPDILRIIGEESKRRGTDPLTSQQIDGIIKTTRAQQAGE
jgi:hypothetical protein